MSDGWAIERLALAVVDQTPAPVRFRIGPARHGYIYEVLEGVILNDCPVYRCCRGRDNDPRLLYLYWDPQTGTWQAVSVAVGAMPTPANILAGANAFRGEQGDDVRQPGTHRWQCFDIASHTWWPASPFDTHVFA